MIAKQIMTQNVECVTPTTPIAKAAQKMRDRDIGFLAVCEEGHPVGTVTDRDITIRSVAQGRDPRLAPVEEIMSAAAFHCYEDDSVENIIRQMQENEVRRVLILDRQENLVGVVSLGDIAKIAGARSMAGDTLGEISDAA